MNRLIFKELKLSASVLSYLFICFALITLVPSYPILLGSFFITFGIFQSFQSARESNDITFSALLPISKADIVKGKFSFCIIIETCGFFATAILTLLRMTFFNDLLAYKNNALMNANFVFLGFVLLIFGLFNYIFVGGFFKTAYYYGKPFVIYIIVTFLVIAIAETLHHIPRLQALNSFGFDNILLQLISLLIGFMLFIVLTLLSLKKSIRNFEKIDL